jgi:hypothetical protein
VEVLRTTRDAVNPRPHTRRRRISREAWAGLRAAISHQHESLPSDSPRIRPTLPRLRWMEGEAA